MTRRVAKRFGWRFLAFLLTILLCVTPGTLTDNNWPVLAQRGGGRGRLPAVACALVTAQVVCYDRYNAQPQPVTPSGQWVQDFAIAPDDNWIAYRANDAVSIASVSANQQLTVDANAPAPAIMEATATTLSWSPDGTAIAYVTADGFRVAFPLPDNSTGSTVGKVQFIDENDRPAANLRFSPDGTRLAVQSSDQSWSIFAIGAENDPAKPYTLRQTRTLDQAADVAWLDENSVVVAPVAGGLSRLDITSSDSSPAWTVATDHFIKLITASDGTVYALQPDPGDTIGRVVGISSDGKVTAVGTSKIDAQNNWGPDAQQMYYITSGTPILVDRATGAEDYLPFRGVSSMWWGHALPPLVSSITLDADLYFLAPDSNGVKQVWHLRHSGLDPVIQVTSQSSDIQDYAVSPNQTQIAFTADKQLFVGAMLNGSLDTTQDLRVLAQINIPSAEPKAGAAVSAGSEPAWLPSGQQLAYVSDGRVYMIPVDGGGPTQITAKDFPPGPFQYHAPHFSPDGHYLHVTVAGNGRHDLVFNLQDGSALAIERQDLALSWGPNDWLAGLSPAGDLAVVQMPQPQSKTLLTFASPPVDERVAADGSLIYLRRSNWPIAMDVVQLYALASSANNTAGSTPPTPVARSRAFAIAGAHLSPTGRLVTGLEDPGRVNRLVILDLKTGRKVEILGADNVDALQWVG